MEESWVFCVEVFDFVVVYEDEYLFVFDKVFGMVVYLVVGNWFGMVMNGLLVCYLVVVMLFCVGIVYCLDKDISGLMVVGKMLVVVMVLVWMIVVCEVYCEYFVLVWGGVLEEMVVDVLLWCDFVLWVKMVVLLGGKFLCIDVYLLGCSEVVGCVVSGVYCVLYSGCMYQICVYLVYEGYLLVVDMLYGGVLVLGLLW